MLWTLVILILQLILLIHTTTTTTTVLRPFFRDYPGDPVPEETFTHSHLSWSWTILCHLSPSTVIRGILPVQFTCLTVFLHNLSASPFWSTSWSETLHFILHTFLHPIIFILLLLTCGYFMYFVLCFQHVSVGYTLWQILNTDTAVVV